MKETSWQFFFSSLGSLKSEVPRLLQLSISRFLYFILSWVSAITTEKKKPWQIQACHSKPRTSRALDLKVPQSNGPASHFSLWWWRLFQGWLPGNCQASHQNRKQSIFLQKTQMWSQYPAMSLKIDYWLLANSYGQGNAILYSWHPARVAFPHWDILKGNNIRHVLTSEWAGLPTVF